MADAPGGGMWAAIRGMFEGEPKIIVRNENANACIPGSVEILTIADAPFAQGNASYKIVEYEEVVSIPPELNKFRDYISVRYKKESIFQKTDQGWRVQS